MKDEDRIGNKVQRYNSMNKTKQSKAEKDDNFEYLKPPSILDSNIYDKSHLPPVILP